MSSPDQQSPWGTPGSPSGAAGGPPPQPFGPAPQSPGPAPQAPPPMMSPYGMPLAGGGPEGPGGYGPGGPGHGPGGPGHPGRRRTAVITSALAVVAVLGVGAAVALTGGSPKHHPKALAAPATPVSGSFVTGLGGATKPDGADLAGASTNGAQGANLPGGPTGTSSPTGSGQPGQTTNPGAGPTSAPGGAPASTSATTPGHPAGSVSAPAPSIPAPSVTGTVSVSITAPAPKPTTAKPPSSDCTYLDLPAAQMPEIKEGSGNVNAVKQAQCLLKKSELGIKTLAIDGQWGPNTQTAMIDFQKCNNAPAEKTPGGTPPYPKLDVDGVAGPQTWSDLYFWDNQVFNGTLYYCNGTRPE